MEPKAERDFLVRLAAFIYTHGLTPQCDEAVRAAAALLAEEEKRNAVGDSATETIYNLADHAPGIRSAIAADHATLASPPVAEPISKGGDPPAHANHTEQSGNEYGGAVARAANTAPAGPVAEPKRGVEELLTSVRGNLMWNYREGHQDFACKAKSELDEALRLYREERRNFPKWYAGETGWAAFAQMERERDRVDLELSALKARVEKEL